MSRARRWTVSMACVLLVNCSDSSENPLANGLTEDQQTRLIEQSIAQIELTENFTPDNFEPLQRSHIETITEEMQDAAMENLQRRLNKVMLLELFQTVELDPESVEVDARMVDPKKAMVLVTVTGDRTYRTNNASKSSETRFVLSWVITVDGGELVFRHQGIRMRDFQN
jgi:hypothetical protein